MLSKPQVIIIGVLSMTLNIILTIVFVIGWICAYSQTLPENNADQNSRDKFKGMMYGYFFLTIFIGFFLYYLMVFVVATAVGYWYFQQDRNVLKGYANVSKHVGSLTFASLVITIITVLRHLAQDASK
jgi:hypothetical protein